MSNEVTPRISVPITPNENVNASSTQPKVTATTWNANDGAARQRDIERAREIALENQRIAEVEARPENLRIAALEREIQTLKRQFVEWKDIYGSK